MPSPPPEPAPAYTIGVRAAHGDVTARLAGLDDSVSPPSALHDTVADVTALLRASLTRPASLSVLLLGPPGSGKSLILSRALAALADHRLTPVVLSLHGLLHASPTAAWRALAAQLAPSHPPPSHQTECLHLIQNALAAFRQSQTPLLLVLDAFDRFVTPDALCQNVLYALFNFLQDASIRAACVAMSPVADVADGLEKRVRSRFAAREVVVPLPACVNDLLPFLQRAVERTSDDPVTNGPDCEDFELGIEQLMDVAGTLVESDQLRVIIAKHLARSRVAAPVVRALGAALDAAFAGELLNTDDGLGEVVGEADVDARVAVAMAAMEATLLPRDELEVAAEGLAVSEVALLAGLARVQRRGGRAVFGDVWREYQSAGVEKGLVGGEGGGAEVVAWEVAEKGWERLVETGLVVRVGHAPRHMRAVRLGVEPAVVERVVRNHPGAGTVLRRWALAR